MPKAIVELAGIIIVACKPHVAVLPDVYAEWVPGLDDDPDSDVELTIHDQHWVLNILLNNPDSSSELVFVVVARILVGKVVHTLVVRG